MSASFFQLVSEKSRESPIWKGYSQLDRTQWLPAAALEELQLHHLRSLVAHCRREVPYYRDTYQKCGLQEDDLRTLADIRHLPLLARTTWQSHYAHLQAEHLPPPMREAGTASTSGTSGVAIELRQTNLTALWWLAFFLRDLEWCGIDPRGSLACIRAVKLKTDEQKRRFREGLVQPFWHASLRGIIQMGPCHGFDLLQDPRRQLEWLRTTAPRYLLGYPSNLDYLGQLLREERGQIPNLELIQSFAESLEDDMRERIETAFGVPVKNTYSCMEAGYLASPCPVGDGFHVHGENVILEVLDEAGNPCRPGETGRVVITALHNYLTPFVRYEIMDSATVGPANCPCGRGLPLLTKIGGKLRPLFRLADGRRKSSVELLHAIRACGPHRQQQIIQREIDLVVVRIIPAPRWSDEHGRRIPEIAREFFEAPVRTEVELLDFLHLPPGGKLQEVVCELDRREASPRE